MTLKSSHVEDWDFRSGRADVPAEFSTAHVRHTDISQQEVDLLWRWPLQQLPSRLPVRRRQDSIPIGRQQPRDYSEDDGVIVNDKDQWLVRHGGGWL
jgi:hypothetical protein